MSPFHSPLVEALNERSTARLQQLKQRFPHQFHHPDYQYSWPMGWHHLVQQACETLHRQRPQSHWTQIKEKFGGLRLYFDRGPLRADIHTKSGLISLPVWTEDASLASDCYALIAVIESESQSTCGCCSAPGDPAKTSNYLITLCTDCAERYGAAFVRPQEG